MDEIECPYHYSYDKGIQKFLEFYMQAYAGFYSLTLL